MTSGPVIQDDVFSMSLNGTFFDAEKVQASEYSPVEFTVHDPAGKNLQGYLTDYVLNTAFESGFLTGNTLDITYLLDHFLSVDITTDNLGILIPEVLTKYGSGKVVGIKGNFAKAESQAHFVPGKASAQGNLAATITIDGEDAIVAEFDSMQGEGTINAKDGKIFGNLSTVSVGSIVADTF